MCVDADCHFDGTQFNVLDKTVRQSFRMNGVKQTINVYI